MKTSRKYVLPASLLSLVLAVVLLASALTGPALASESAAAEIVNTSTDASQITSPFISVVNEVQQSVVGINNYQTFSYPGGNFSGGSFSRGYGFSPDGSGQGSAESASEEMLAASGSGVVIYEDYILTNYHVVEDASRVTVTTLVDDEEHEGTVVGTDSSLDIAIIHVPGLNLPAVELGDSDSLQVGEWAICIGNPLSSELAGTVTMGIISALDREISTNNSTTDKYGLRVGGSNSMIQTNAAINSGNSGGGLFNILGQLQGIPTLKYSGSYFSSASIEGIGMAIPINAAKPLIEQVLSGETVSEGDQSASDDEASPSTPGSPRLGVSVVTINSENNSAVAQGALPKGAMIAEIEEKSPASTASLQINDIIVEANGTVITSVEDLQAQISGKAAGDTLTIKLYRVPDLDKATSVSEIKQGEYIDIDVTLTTFS